jgi:curli biogenesis system outer membrane secretion channel CsgG
MQKKIIGLMLVLMLSALLGCSSHLTKSFLREDVDFSYIQTLAVLPFENLGPGGPAAAQRIREITITQVLVYGIFDVVDRGRVDSMLREEAIDIGAAAAIDPITLKRLGQRLGVQAFMMGSVEQVSDAKTGTAVYPETTITLRLVDVDSGKVLWQATGRGSGYSLLDRLFGVAPKDAFRVTVDLIGRMLNTITGK